MSDVPVTLTAPFLCPVNGCNLDGDLIPPEYAPLYDAGARRYSRAIGVTIRGLYDGTAFFECPDCGCRWHRFPPGDPVHARVRGLWRQWELEAAKAASWQS